MSDQSTPTVSTAPLWRRGAALLIDATLVPALTLILVMATDAVENAEDYADGWWMLHVLLLAILSYVLLNGVLLWRRGQTLGKALMGIMIVPADFDPAAHSQPLPAPLWKLICIRAWAFPLAFCLLIPWLAWLPVIDALFLFRKDRRSLHDLIAGTAVIRRHPP